MSARRKTAAAKPEQVGARHVQGLPAVARVEGTPTVVDGAKIVEVAMFRIGANPSVDDKFGRAPLYVSEEDFAAFQQEYEERKTPAPLDLMHSQFKPIINPETGQPIGKIGDVLQVFERDSICWARCAVMQQHAARLKEFTYPSAVYAYEIDDQGRERPRSLHSLALLNTPSLDTLPPVSAAGRGLPQQLLRAVAGGKFSLRQDARGTWIDSAEGSMYVETMDADEIIACLLGMLRLPVTATQEEVAGSISRLYEMAASSRGSKNEDAAASRSREGTMPENEKPKEPAARTAEPGSDYVTMAQLKSFGEELVKQLKPAAPAVVAKPEETSAPDATEQRVRELVETARSEGRCSKAEVPALVSGQLATARAISGDAGIKLVETALSAMPVRFAPDAGVTPKPKEGETQRSSAGKGNPHDHVGPYLGSGHYGNDYGIHRAAIDYQNRAAQGGHKVSYREAVEAVTARPGGSGQQGAAIQITQ